MNEIIRKRKAIRKYEPAELDAAMIEKIEQQLINVKPLYNEIQFAVGIANKTKRSFGINAPHFLVFSSEEKEGAYENIGFVGQQMDLFFSENELGSCWAGMAKPEEKDFGKLNFVICMAFGKPDEPLYRGISEFNRKSLMEMSEGTDERLEAARLAPSGMNSQNWYFIADNGKIHCYRKKTGFLLKSMMEKMSLIDMGIALCHIEKESIDFVFEKEVGVPEKKGYVYVGTVGHLKVE